MKNIENLIQKAVELQSNGLTSRQIADELNVSRDTVTWLLTRAKKDVSTPAPKDISVNWVNIGKNAYRLRNISKVLCDMALETLEQTDDDVDLIVGIGLSGVPLASLMAEEFGTDLAVFHTHYDPADDKHLKGDFSGNFSSVKGKKCVIVDDVITSGYTMMEVIKRLREEDCKPVAIAVLVDKKGAELISDVPVRPLVRIVRVD
ncbi:MAG: orotate phosphoribosyltransferase-like protein [Methanomethylovorans sp.]|uniref:orotate phosphoribosyltransferase-like protein n=1 Tax=Methanomethylovorans sp. TaxID=2758717 RepID=UPI003530A63D